MMHSLSAHGVFQVPCESQKTQADKLLLIAHWLQICNIITLKLFLLFYLLVREGDEIKQKRVLF